MSFALGILSMESASLTTVHPPFSCQVALLIPFKNQKIDSSDNCLFVSEEILESIAATCALVSIDL
jgi:hypothetical protein